MKRKTICIAMLAIFAGSAPPAGAAESLPKALFAYGAINAYMESTWIAKEQGIFRKHNVEVEPVFIIATQAAQAMLAGEVPVRAHRSHSRDQCGSGRRRHGHDHGQSKQSPISIDRASEHQTSGGSQGKKSRHRREHGGFGDLSGHRRPGSHRAQSCAATTSTLRPTGAEPLRLAAVKSGVTQATVVSPEIGNPATTEGYPILSTWRS